MRLTGIDLDGILRSENALELIQALSPQSLYFALKEKGPEDCLEVLECMSSEQVRAVVDYEAWQKDRLVPKQAFKWLNLFKEISREQFFQRYTELDEEYQTSLLGPYVRILDQETVETLSDVDQDKLFALAEGQLYLSIESEDKDVQSFILDLVDIFLGENPNYCLSLLAHASYLPPNEQEELVFRFRNARLEEDGYVSFEKSLEIFQPIDHQKYLDKYIQSSNQWEKQKDSLVSPGETNTTFFARVLHEAQIKGILSVDESEHLQQRFILLANSMCSACSIEPDDLVGLKMILEHCQGLSSLGLEYLSQGNVERACTILGAEHPQTVFRIGLSLVYELRKIIVKQLRALVPVDLAAFDRAFSRSRFGEVIYLADKILLPILGFEATEVLKGIFNRFPMVADRFYLDDDQVERVVFRPLSSLSGLASLETQWLAIGNQYQSGQADKHKSGLMPFNIHNPITKPTEGLIDDRR
jgi:hypothetical protein